LRLFGEESINLWQLRSRMGVLNIYRGDVRGFDVVLSGFFGSVGLGRSQQPDEQQRTHRLEEIQPEISRVVLLKRGTVMADGPTDELLRDQPLSTLFNTPLRVVTGGGYRQALPAPRPV
jgi:ABC-type molybdenum transport system ATPase subunit/photorepair protein PhrA